MSLLGNEEVARRQDDAFDTRFERRFRHGPDGTYGLDWDEELAGSHGTHFHLWVPTTIREADLREALTTTLAHLRRERDVASWSWAYEKTPGLHVALVGNISSGYAAHGPYPDFDAADDAHPRTQLDRRPRAHARQRPERQWRDRAPREPRGRLPRLRAVRQPGRRSRSARRGRSLDPHAQRGVT